MNADDADQKDRGIARDRGIGGSGHRILAMSLIRAHPRKSAVELGFPISAILAILALLAIS
jgi:hypothetical protein